MHGDSQPMDAMPHAMHVMPGGPMKQDVAATGVVRFPVAIPSVGRYRVFVQVRRMNGVIETAALDVTVPEAVAAR